ncbi:MAG TPA: hypothetical protein VF756_08250 [Thermoanaerobaculia bacterium]
MSITPPFDESGSGAAAVVSRDRQELLLPPRSAMPAPGSRSVFGLGFFRRLRDSQGSGCFILLFCGIGLTLFLFGVAGTVGPWKEGLRGNNDPRSFLGVMIFGAVFFLVPLRMLQIVLTGAEKKSRGRTSKKEPWTADYPWRREWMPPDYSGGGSGWVLGRVAFLALIGLFNLALAAPSWVARIVILAFDLLGLLILYDTLHKLTQWLRFRHPVATWTTFPAFLGDRLEGRISFARPVRVAGAPKVTLRCVGDERVTRMSGKHQSSQLQPFALYQETREAPQAVKPGEPLDYVDFGFDVPGDLPGTDLLKETATYWQVCLDVPIAGPNLEAVFLAPVYRRTQ